MVRKAGAWGWTRPSVTVRDGSRWFKLWLRPCCDLVDDLMLSHPLIFLPFFQRSQNKSIKEKKNQKKSGNADSEVGSRLLLLLLGQLASRFGRVRLKAKSPLQRWNRERPPLQFNFLLFFSLPFRIFRLFYCSIYLSLSLFVCLNKWFLEFGLFKHD